MAMYGDRTYAPTVPPESDTQELAEQGERLMLRHNRATDPEIFVAERGIQHAGWVIGTFFNYRS